MRLLLSVQTNDGDARDVVVLTDATATVGDAARALDPRDDETLATLFLKDGDRWDEIDPALAVAESPVGSGAVVRIGAPKRARQSSSRSIRLMTGPSAGRRISLRHGVNTIGRDPECDVVVDDDMVSRWHARILVQEDVEIVDDNSVNGLLSGGEPVQRVNLQAGDSVVVGNTTLVLEESNETVLARQLPPGTVAFNRSPRVVPLYLGEKFDAPEPPAPVSSQPVPWVAAALPIVMGPVLYLATHRWQSMLFVLLSPVMAIGNYFQNKTAARRQFAEAVAQFEEDLAGLVAALRQAQDRERAVRLLEHPSVADVVHAIDDLGPLLWTRRREHQLFLDVRLGLGRQFSRTEVHQGAGGKAPWDLRQQVEASVEPFVTIDNVPVVCRLQESGALGISGPLSVREGVGAGVVAELVGLHSPADLCVAAVVSPAGGERWNWLKWLPHVLSEQHPLGINSLADTAGAISSMLGEVVGMIDEREGEDGDWTGPALVVLVEDEAPFVRSTLVELAERGPTVGVYVLWCAEATSLLPAVCRTFLELEPNSFGAATGKVREGERVTPVVTESVDHPTAEWVGRRLAPVVDSSISAASESDIPGRVSLVAEMGLSVTESPEFVVEQWRESNSVRLPGDNQPRLRRDNNLRAMVGRTNLDPLYLDLRGQGPHALVGGTTGAGKSEFLQTWVLSMAARHSPERVTFLFVDYKGGAAFADCVALPHAVGLVTDLSPRLVQRALRSLNAELRYREHILNRKRAKDLLELERRQDPEVPPSLVIVVDEFAALVQEVPEFVDGVVNVAQRGRSLGLHLILATQRPAGVIKGNLRANTNLRVALRMADADDSSDVVGIPDAADFDPSFPGRGIAKTGPGRMSVFQSAYVGGVTESVDRAVAVEVRDLPFAPGALWEKVADEEPSHENETAPDIHRIVDTIRGANDQLGLETPRRPWLPELADCYDLASLPTQRTDVELIIGVRDEPDDQRQGLVAFRPESDGNLLVIGTGGAGKSTALRSLAVAAGLTVRGGPCHVYGLDFGSRGLAMLESLPHVGSIIDGDDVERVARMFRKLRAMVDDRAMRFSEVNAGTLTDYREIARRPDEQRILLLLDGLASFRSAFEGSTNSWMLDALQSLVADGRAVGVHVVLTADRIAALPSSLASGVQRRLVLRVAGDNELMGVGLSSDAFDEDTPAGRGYLDDYEVQVAVLGGSREVMAQARAMERLADSMSRAGSSEAEAIARLPEEIALSELPVTDSEGRPVFGMLDETLGPIGVDMDGLMLVTGPAKSGRSTAVATVVAALRRSRPLATIAYLGWVRSPLAGSVWDRKALGAEESATLASELTSTIAVGESPTAVVIDGIADFVSTEADMPLQDLIKACRKAGVMVVVDGDATDINVSWPLLQAVKAPRHGIVLQPEQSDGDTLLKTSFPRVRRAEFPVGRGIYVRQGRTYCVQVARMES